MKKMVIVWLLALCMMCTVSALAEESNDFAYTVLEDGTAQITEYAGSETVVVIPAVLDGYAVTSIGDEAFFYCTDITSITIPDSVTSIGSEAFGACFSLESMTIPDSVTSIGANPFSYCKSLTTVEVSPEHPTLAIVDGVLYSKPDNRIVWYPMNFTASSFSIPEGITAIGVNSFAFNRYLTGVTIPDSVTAIEATAFAQCENLTNVTIPDSVTSIGDGAFSGCPNLTCVTIPDSVVSLGSNPFAWCYSLTKVEVSPEHPTLAATDGVLISKPDNRLVWYPINVSASSYSIPQGITVIGDEAFHSCYNLTTVTIPDSVTSIGNWAFSSSPDLTGVTIPDSVTSIGEYAFYWCINLTSVTIPDSVTFIGEEAFLDCPNLTITVTGGSYAEQYCTDEGLAYTYAD